GGAVMTATYAGTEPALLQRLQESGTPYLIEPQSMRFATGSFRETRALTSLPYAPPAALDPTKWTNEHEHMVEGALRFQAAHGASHYLVPALPYERPTPDRLNTHRALHELAVSLNGTDGIPRKPLVGMA